MSKAVIGIVLRCTGTVRSVQSSKVSNSSSWKFAAT